MMTIPEFLAHAKRAINVRQTPADNHPSETSMNSATLSNSPRLQRVLTYLSDGKRHSTLEIVHGARVCAVNSIVSELRRNGIAVACHREKGVYFYKLGN